MVKALERVIRWDGRIASDCRSSRTARVSVSGRSGAARSHWIRCFSGEVAGNGRLLPFPRRASHNGAMNDVTQILSDIQNGQSQRAGDLFPLVYEELRRLASQRMAKELPGQTLSPTALVHEAFVRMVGRGDAPRWENRVHFYRAAAQAMRRILIDRARRRMGPKQGGSLKRQPLADAADEGVLNQDALLEIIALDEALARLEQTDPRTAELIKLRFFAGLSLDDAACAIGISPRTADTWWAYGRAFLAAEMDRPES